MADNLHNAPIVLDNGSGTIRAGFAGEDLPKCYFPSFVGRPKHLRVLAGALEGDVFIGQRAQELRGLLKIRYPLEHGIVTDWDDMERIWQWVYGEGLKTLSEEVRLLHPALPQGKLSLGGSLHAGSGHGEIRWLMEILASCLINRTTSQSAE
jgi:actin-related protein